jgi:hypothetical protein
VRPHVPTGPRPGRCARRLLLAAALITVLGVVTGGPVGALALAVALTALVTAAVVMMRAHWVAAGDAGLPPPTAGGPPAEPVDVQAALRRLRAEHIAAVDAALDAGRHDLARALVVAHQEESRRLLEGITTRPVG